MPDYRRNRVAGGTYFFTANLLERDSARLVAHIDGLREAVRTVCARHPFHIDAWVVLPDHMHAEWTLPADDADYPGRWTGSGGGDGAAAVRRKALRFSALRPESSPSAEDRAFTLPALCGWSWPRVAVAVVVTQPPVLPNRRSTATDFQAEDRAFALPTLCGWSWPKYGLRRKALRFSAL